MCVGIALAYSVLPLELLERYQLVRRVHERGGERELQFFYRDREPLLPVWHEGQLRLVRWGVKPAQSEKLPRTGWTWLKTVESGGWAAFEVDPVDVPATMGLEGGIWFRIRQGVRGLLVRDEHGVESVYLICEPASHYFRVMTRSSRMPVLINERI